MIRTIAYLKTLFQTGDVPTQSDFEDLFDTFGQWHLMLESLGASQDNAQMAWLCLPANITFPVGFAGSAGAGQVTPAA